MRLQFERETKTYFLYKEVGGINQWYLPKDYFPNPSNIPGLNKPQFIEFGQVRQG